MAAAILPIAARLPSASAGWILAPAPDERLVLIDTSGPTRIVVPARHGRLLAASSRDGRACAAVRFATTTLAGESMDLLLVAGDGRILGLEPWGGVATGGAHLSSRLDLPRTGPTLVLHRDAAVPRQGGILWERQSWIDSLVLADSGLLGSPSRTPLAGTWQASLSAQRAAVSARLRQHHTALLDPALIGLAASWPWAHAAS
jgi:hypothetical protein